MSSYDLLFRGGTLVAPEGLVSADVAVVDGRVVATGPDLEGSAVEIVDASGRHLFPGFIDAHVHFNEPGREHWEGLFSGSRSLAAGGGTSFFEMPLNAAPPTLDGEGFARKRACAEAKSVLDFALWGGLTPINLDTMEEMADAGAIGFKAFMSRCGTSDFPNVDAPVLKRGMKIATARNLPVAVHAEDDLLTYALAEERRSQGKTGWQDYLDSRPIEAELRAIRVALELAGEVSCDLHIVHVSCPEGIDLIRAARDLGVRVTAETCPHYLLFTDQSLDRIGATAKCAPPLRDAARREEMWKRIQTGLIDTLGSDHSPSPPEMKIAGNFFDVWGGIAGCQHAFPLALAEWYARSGLEGLPPFSAVSATNVAERFGIGRQKGRLAEGFDADITLVDMRGTTMITPEQLAYRHAISPYVGLELRAIVDGTWVRGRAVYRNGKFPDQVSGRLLTPAQSAPPKTH
ncbi:MAG: allantoinase [Verrucomicrobiota bacterium]|jgi:allantoinase|nr:allantoinase [Verrucomicrobiota bacterium]